MIHDDPVILCMIMHVCCMSAFFLRLLQETKKDTIVKRISPAGWCDIPGLWKALDAGHNMLEVWACYRCSLLHLASGHKRGSVLMWHT